MTSVRRASGFTLVELLLAATLTVFVAGAVVMLAAFARDLAVAAPESVDLHQRLRVAIRELSRDLSMAGAGLTWTGVAGHVSLAPAIVPARMGLDGADPPFAYFSDRITVVYSPLTRSRTSLSVDMSSSSSALFVRSAPQEPQCPVDPACGFDAGVRAIVMDGGVISAGEQTFAFDIFTVTRAVGGSLEHGPPNLPFTRAYRADSARIVEAREVVYYHDAGQQRLMRYDGYGSHQSVVEGVTGITFSYEGEAAPPDDPKPPIGVSNCLFDASGAPRLAHLGAPNARLVPLGSSDLADAAPTRCGAPGAEFDPDLLRIRTIRVTVRLQATRDDLRRARGRVIVPDASASFAVSPRNLRVERRRAS